MGLENFIEQSVSHSITNVDKEIKKVLKQTVTMKGKVGDGDLIQVKNPKDNNVALSVSRNKGKYFLNFLGLQLTNQLGQTLDLSNRKVEIVADSSAPVKIGAGLEDELIVDISFGNGKKGKAKVTPTLIEIEYDNMTYSNSTLESGFCYDIDMTADVVEAMFEKDGNDSRFFKTPVIFGRGEKCPIYLLGMYASQIDDNRLVKLGNHSIFKVKTDAMSQPIVFFGQKDKLFVYNNGKIERAVSYHYSKDKNGDVSLAIERVGDKAYLKVPLGVNQKNGEKVADVNGNKILDLFNGFTLPPQVGKNEKNQIFKAPEKISTIEADQRKWAEYKFRYKSLSQKVSQGETKSLSFQATVFDGDDNVHYVNPVLGKIFYINNLGKLAWEKISDFKDKILGAKYKVSNINIEIQQIQNQIIFVDTNSGTFSRLNSNNVLKPITTQEYQILSESTVSDNTEEPQIEVLPPENKIADKQTPDLQYEARPDNTIWQLNPGAKEVESEVQKFTQDEEPKPKNAFDDGDESPAEATISEEAKPQVAENDNNESETPAVKTQEPQASNQNAEETHEDVKKAKEEEKKPKETKYDWKKKVETFGNIAISFGLFMTLTGAIFMPILAIVGIVLTCVSTSVVTFPDAFKFSVFEGVEKKISDAERQTRDRLSPEREIENFNERDREYDAALDISREASQNIKSLCMDPAQQSLIGLKNLFDEFGPLYPELENETSILNFDRLIDAESLSVLSYRISLTQAITDISKAKTPALKAQQIDNLISTYFSAVPEERRSEIAKNFEDNSSLESLSRAFNSLNEAQLKQSSILQAQREFLTDEKLGEKRILKSVQSLTGEGQLKFLNRYGDAIACVCANHPERADKFVRSVASCVEEEFQGQALFTLQRIGKEAEFNLSSSLDLTEEALNKNLSSIDLARDYANVILAGEGLTREPSSNTEMVKAYTHGIYHEQITQKEGELLSFIQDTASIGVTGEESELLDEIQSALSSEKFEASLKRFELDGRNASVDEKLEEYASTGLINSMLPSVDDKHFCANKSYYSLAGEIAKSSIADFDNRYTILTKKRNLGKKYVVAKAKPTLKLASSNALIAKRENDEKLVESVKNLNKCIADENKESINALIQVANKINNSSAIVIDQTILENATKEVKSSVLGKSLSDEQVTLVAKAKAVVKQKYDALNEKSTSSTQSELENGAKANVYIYAEDFIGIALNGHLPQVRLANSYDNFYQTERGKTSTAPEEICGVTQQERLFNKQYNSFIANLSREEQRQIKAKLSVLHNPSPADKNRVLSEVVGNKKVAGYKSLSDITLSETDKNGELNIEGINAELEKIKLAEVKRVEKQLLFAKDRFAGLNGFDSQYIKSLIGNREALLKGNIRKYRNVFDWIQRTQKISKDTILTAYGEVLKHNKHASNTKLTRALFKQLGIDSEDVSRQFNSAQDDILNLKIARALTLADKSRAKDIIKVEEMRKDVNFRNSFNAIMDKISTQGLTTDNYIEISTLLNAPESAEVVAKLGLRPEILNGVLTSEEDKTSAEELLQQFRNGEVYKYFDKETFTKSEILGSFVNKEERNEIKIRYQNLTSQTIEYELRANEFKSIFAQVEAQPTDANKKAVMEFLLREENNIFLVETFGQTYANAIISANANTAKDFDKFVSTFDISKTTLPDGRVIESAGKVQAMIDNACDNLAERVAVLDSKIHAESDETRDNMDILLLKNKVEVYDQKAQEFENIYKNFITSPTDKTKCEEIMKFIYTNDEFMTISGISAGAIIKLVNACYNSQAEAKQLAKDFDEKHNIKVIALDGKTKLLDKLDHLRKLQTATTQQEIDLINLKRKEALFNDGNTLGKKIIAINKLNNVSDEFEASNDVMKYYSLISRLNELTSLSERHPTNEIIADIENVENAISEIVENSPLGLDYFNVEEDRIFASEMMLSSAYVEDMIEDDEPEIDDSLTGKAKLNAIKKRNKKMASKLGRLQKRFNSMRDEALSKKAKLEKEKKKIEEKVVKVEKKPTPEKKVEGLSLFAKIAQSLSKERLEKDEKTAVTTEIVKEKTAQYAQATSPQTQTPKASEEQSRE